MYNTFRPLLFRFDPELIHKLTLHLIKWAGLLPPTYALLSAIFEVNDPRLEVEAFGVKFRNPIGLAAGYDKDGIAVRGLSALGFGHIEVGTITRQKQIGNPKPRVQRVVEAQGVINSMGFPNKGVQALMIRRGEAKVGVNIGKSKDTPLERAAEDYVALFKQVYRQADYVALNISSPNTLNLRQLQARDYLEELLKEVTRVRDHLAAHSERNEVESKSERSSTALRSAQNEVESKSERSSTALCSAQNEVESKSERSSTALRSAQNEVESKDARRVPVLVKIAPDLTEREVEDVLTAIDLAGIDGVIATNTTLAREGIPPQYHDLKGGLSGRPLRDRSTAMINCIYRKTEGKLPIIGVGGVMSPFDALEKLQAGAALVQVYTGLVYAGPGLVKRINQELLKREA